MVTEEEIYQAYSKTVARLQAASYEGRQNVYSALHKIHGLIWVARNGKQISDRLNQIEQEVTGRDCRDDWMTIGGRLS